MDDRASTIIQTFKTKPHIVAVYSTSPSKQLIAFSASLPNVRSVCVLEVRALMLDYSTRSANLGTLR
jgi:hypothetical protein